MGLVVGRKTIWMLMARSHQSQKRRGKYITKCIKGHLLYLDQGVVVASKTIDIQQHVKEAAQHAAHRRSICIPPSRSCITCGYDEKSHHPSSEENIKRICSLSTSALVLTVPHPPKRLRPKWAPAQKIYTDTRFPHDVCIQRDRKKVYYRYKTRSMRITSCGMLFALSPDYYAHVGAAYFVFIFGYGVAHAKRSFGWPAHVLQLYSIDLVYYILTVCSSSSSG